MPLAKGLARPLSGPDPRHPPKQPPARHQGTAPGRAGSEATPAGALPAAAVDPPAPLVPCSVGFLLALAVALFGASWPLAKVALATTAATPVWLAASRSCLACCVLTVALGLRGRLSLPSRADLPTLLAVGLLQLTGFFALCHYAVRLVPAGHTAVLSNAAMIWIVPLAALTGQREPPVRWIAAAIAAAGLAVLVGPWSVDWARPDVVLGYTLLFVAAFTWACTIVVTRFWPPRADALGLLPWAFALSAAMLLALAVVAEPGGGVPAGAWGFAAFNGAVVAPFGTYCLVELSRRLTPTASSVLFMSIPVVGVLASALALGEAIGGNLALGAGMIATGVGLAARGRASK